MLGKRIHPGLLALIGVATFAALMLIIQSVQERPMTVHASQTLAPTGLSEQRSIDVPKSDAGRVADIPDANVQPVLRPSAIVRPGDLPDPQLTPGLADATLTKDVLCAPEFTTRTHREVTSAGKTGVYKSYHLEPTEPPCPCEIDHLIPLELGGANEPTNLWPQSYMTQPWNARVKDRLEKRLHAEVCAGKIDLGAGQHDIASNWIEAYIARFGQPK